MANQSITSSKLSKERLQQLIAEAEANEAPAMTAPPMTKRRGRPRGSKNKPKQVVQFNSDIATTLLHSLPDSLRQKLTWDDISTIAKLVALDKSGEAMHIASHDTH